MKYLNKKQVKAFDLLKEWLMATRTTKASELH